MSSLVVNSSHHFLILNFHRYPADGELEFEKFKPHKNWIDANTLDTDAGDALKAIMWSKFYLNVFREDNEQITKHAKKYSEKVCDAVPMLIGIIANPAFYLCIAYFLIELSAWFVTTWAGLIA